MKLKESLITRRRFLQGWIAGVGALLFGQITYIWARFLMPRPIDVGPPEITLTEEEYKLRRNTSRIFMFGHKPALLIRTGEGEYLAMSAVCTHFECTVNYDVRTKQIACPCHKGVFDVYGNNISGPPPLPLKRFAVLITDEGLLISRDGIEKEHAA